LLEGGVSLVGPETIFVDADVEVGPDTTILPFTCLQGRTTTGGGCLLGPHATIVNSRLGDGVTVRASVVEDSTIAGGADVGPYSHLRAGTDLGPGVHVGNFAELKSARLGADVKVGHVAYLGDADVGQGANIGAGTITANWDGRSKHRTDIGAGAFVGVDTMLVAPIRFGAGARSGAGSVVTNDVPAGATVVGVPARVVRLDRTPAADTDDGAPAADDEGEDKG